MAEQARNTHVFEDTGMNGLAVCKALASSTRMRILDLLAEHDRNISELSQLLGISQPTVTKHTGILAEAGLIRREYSSGIQGMQTRCRLVYDRFIFNLSPLPAPDLYIDEIEMPIGLYTYANPMVTCGLVNQETYIGAADQPQVFFFPQRSEAQLLWTAGGYVEYTFPNRLPGASIIHKIEFSAELCSETSDFNLDYPSDITVWINGVEIGTWTSPGDMGGKLGRLNPSWWSPLATQYGFLKTWSVDDDGCYIDDAVVSPRPISELRLEPGNALRVRIGIKPEAINPGGFNLFGRCFGNYEQDLILRLHYSGSGDLVDNVQPLSISEPDKEVVS